MTESPEGHDATAGETEEFGQLVRYTIIGYAGGLVLGTVLDARGLQRSGLGQWLVRTVSGEGESLLEGLYAARQRFSRRAAGMAEAYGWGKLLGMAVPWVIDWGSRQLGINVYGVEGFYLPFFYAMSDQLGANVSGFVFLRRRRRTWGEAIRDYLRHPVMLTGLIVVLAVPAGLLAARIVGFSPTTQTLTALETIVANLCWLPPAVGWWSERRASRTPL